MFSFFRRQGKKQGGGTKKSKKQAEFAFINDIHCMPVDKYQIDFCKPINDDTLDKNPQSTYIPLTMGNSESSKKCSNESLDTGYGSDSSRFNNNVCSPKGEPEFSWESIPAASKTMKADSEFRWEPAVPHTDQFQWEPTVPPPNAKYENTEFRWEPALPSKNTNDSFNNSPNTPVNENVASRADFSQLSQKSQPARTEGPPLAVQEDLDACDTPLRDTTDAQIKHLEAKLEEIIEPKTNNVPNLNAHCDRSSIRFADSDEENEEEKTQPSCDPGQDQDSPHSSIYSNEEEEDDYAAPENKNEQKSTSKRTLRIPDITITESSDSEAENDSDDEFQVQYYPEHRYERTYPTILYDITEVDEPFSDASDMESNGFNGDKRNFVQEAEFDENIQSLKCKNETKDMENMQLKDKINDLQRDILNKTWGMDQLHAELASFQTEADCVRKKLLKVENDLVKYKNKNMELNEELVKTLGKGSDLKLVDELQNELEELKSLIQDLQKELNAAQTEKQRLQEKLIEIEKDKNEKLKTMEIALDETLKQKQKLQAHFDTEYEKLRTLNSDREQQLVDDFEWKLREVEITCKRKLEDKEKTNEEKINQVRKQLETEIAQLKDQKKVVEKLKSFQAEAVQLRGLTQEQERSLRMAMRTSDQLQNNQRYLSEEIDKLRNSLEKERAHLATVQGIHSREIAEKDKKYSSRLEQQKKEINAQWEDKVRKESTRLKLDIEKQYKDEKRILLDEVKSKSEQQLKDNNEMWNKKLAEYKKELETLDKKLIEKEKSYREILLRLQTNSDRDMLDLRRKLDKLDLFYQDQLEKKEEQHEIEINNLREEYEKRLQQSEQNWSQQVSSTRATLELVKEQLQREAESHIEALNKKYMIQLEQQHERLTKEKEYAIAEMQEKYSNEMCDLQNQLNEELKLQKTKEIEMLTVIDDLRLELTDKNSELNVLQETHDALENIISELKEKTMIYDNLRKEAENTLKHRETEHANTLTKVRERYENEIKQLQLKLATLERNMANSSAAREQMPESTSNIDDANQSTPNQSKSSRRRNRGRHRNQRNNQHPQLTHQFSL